MNKLKCPSQIKVHFQNEMLNLKQNNERLQRLVTSRSLAGSQSSLGTGGSAVEDPRRFSLADQATMHQVRNLFLCKYDISVLSQF